MSRASTTPTVGDQITPRAGRRCPHHGTFTGILATSPEFLGRIERKPSQSNSSSDPRMLGVFPAA